MPSKKILVLADIEDGLTYYEFRKRYKELVDGLTQKEISYGYKLYKNKQEDKPIIIKIDQTDIEKAESAYRKYNDSSTKIGTNKISNFKWSYYVKNKNGEIELKDFDIEKSNRIETCYRDVLKNGGQMCKHMNIDFLSMRWKRSQRENIDVVRQRSDDNINAIKGITKEPSYREISNIPINKKTSTSRLTPRKKKCCS